MFIIKYRKVFISISALFVLISLGFLLVFKLHLGIDFKGGSAITYTYSDIRPEPQLIKKKLADAGFAETSVQPVGEKGVQVKTVELNEGERAEIISAMNINGAFPGAQESFTAIGPSVGKELKHKAIVSIILVLIAIILFVAYAFRKVSKPVSSWKYGIAVIIALIHDVIIPSGVFALLGHTIGAEVDTLFIVALLTTLALSVADTIVVFDRVRENLTVNKSGKSFETIVGESLSQTFVRSINTSVMVLIMVLSLAIFGPKSTQLFAIVLAIGMFFGTYSSIFLASPLLVTMEKFQKKSKK
jgi:preprotein translocase subunit SecF